jgi:hypothetical protein
MVCSLSYLRLEHPCPSLALRDRELYMSKLILKGVVEKGHEKGFCKLSQKKATP